MARGGRVAEDRGAVTVEAALALCSLVVVLAVALAGFAAVSAQLRCIDAAREAARLTARGESDRAVQVGQRIAPREATVEITTTGDEIRVIVEADPFGAGLSFWEVRAEALAIMEPGVGAATNS